MDLTTAYESTVVDNTAPHTPVEAIAQVGNLACRALIDTGSRVNLISRVLYDCILADQEASPELFSTPLQPVRGALHGADSARIRLLAGPSQCENSDSLTGATEAASRGARRRHHS